MAKIGQIGLSGLHLAKRNELTNEVDTDTTISVAGLVTAEVEIETVSENIYADDVVAEVIASGFSSGTVTMELLGLSMEEYALISGQEIVDGVVADNSNVLSPVLAMTFKSQKSNGTYRYVSLPQVKANIKGESFTTKEDGVEIANVEIEFSIIPMAETGIWRVRADQDACKNTEFLNTFLTTFPENVPTPLEMLKNKK
ncbi:Phage protein, tail component [Romboutsia ilealis]|uniref:Phage protein, tail component n=1 Tax=Romboutsia ilealis TaxID=1115758 RepID=A0A1V1HZ72_9FIRM|nr:major tail protein [Romboutsia ilealis]CED93261.1 Phage protein, tail component [Romboutsia ilealis]